MNEEKINNRANRMHRRFNNGRGNVWTGLFLLVIGGLLLARTAGVPFPLWFFSWPMIFIGIGLFIGVRHGFRGAGWIMPLLIGGIFLTDKIVDDINLRPYFWPIILIGAGLVIIFRPKSASCKNWQSKKDDFSSESYTPQSYSGNDPINKGLGSHADVIDITAVFSGVKKNVISKNFKGGDIMAFMGGVEINLSQADFQGRVMIDTFNMFGGTKLVIPPDWEVQSDIAAIFGGVDDKRPQATHQDPNKIVILDGTCIFGGIEIRSF